MCAALQYMSGFGNEFETEALEGALPRGQNSPQRCAYGLYAEQISGSAFTAPRNANRRSWLYRIRPSVLHARRFAKAAEPLWKTAPGEKRNASVSQLRWGPVAIPSEDLTFVSGMRTMTTAGDADQRAGMSAHMFLVTRSMSDDYFYDADGELLVIPQQGKLQFFTEFGRIDAGPGEICVIPRGVKFQVLTEGPARGFMCENYGAAFTLPLRGAIGANCLANARDFKTPVAAFEDREAPCVLIVKWGGEFYRSEIGQSPLDVVAWHGNYAPYKYDLRDFCPVGALLFDHPDPSIFTALTSPSDELGVGNVDFALFSDRWLVGEHTFRPPWYHTNVMSEFMALIEGEYDAKPQGFAPGGMSLHNMVTPHGPDAVAFARASSVELKPEKLAGSLAFMFESRLPQHLTDYAASLPTLDADYVECWSDLPKLFDGSAEGRRR